MEASSVLDSARSAPEISRVPVHPGLVRVVDQRVGRTTSVVIKVLLTGWLLVALALQSNIGLADNGDFTRAILLFANRPDAASTTPVASVPADESTRFFDAYLPYWTVEWSVARPTSSAVLLWLPGVALNLSVYSRTVLYLPIVSIVHRIAFIVFLWVLCDWVERYSPFKTVLMLTVGIPTVLLFTSTDYAAYINSFYEESASMTFLFFTLCGLVYVRRKPTWQRLGVALVLLELLATSKSNAIYWPLVALPILTVAAFAGRSWKQRFTLVVVGALVLLTLVSVSSYVTRAGTRRANAYNSLFYGLLTFSDHPSTHLARLGLMELEHCVGQSAYSEIGRKCSLRLLEINSARKVKVLSFMPSFSVIVAEPMTFVRELKHVLDSMQDVSLEYLRKHPVNDPAGQQRRYVAWAWSQEHRAWDGATESTGLNFWALMKWKVFPTGWLLVAALAVFAGTCAVVLLPIERPEGFEWLQDLAVVALATSFATMGHIVVNMLGDGRYELIKHLYLGNVVFDIAAIAWVNIVIGWALIARREHARTKAAGLVS